MMRFRLKTDDGHGNRIGHHALGFGKERIIVRAGDVIESDQPLDVLFRNKFERIAEPEPSKENEN